MKASSLLLISLVTVFAMLAGCSSAHPAGSTTPTTSAPFTSTVPQTSVTHSSTTSTPTTTTTTTTTTTPPTTSIPPSSTPAKTTATPPPVSSIPPTTLPGGQRIGGTTIGGTPTKMPHPTGGAYQDCLSCHGLNGMKAALVLIDQTTHPCNECHALSPPPDFPSHDNGMMTNTTLLNTSCITCHVPAT